MSTSQQEQAKMEELRRQPMPTIPGYTLKTVTGHGAFSLVYAAIDQQNNHRVAVKVFRKDRIDMEQRKSILKEIQLMRRLRHPNLVNFLKAFETEATFVIVMELMEGGELFDRIIAKEKFTEKEASNIITQVARGIAYLHDNGIVHRDIKPENLLFQDATDDKIKLADFGLAKLIYDEVTQTPCGTMGYIAPEIVADHGYSKSVDMWALGCVLYTLLCGYPPFYDEDVYILTDKITRGEYDFPAQAWSRVSDQAIELIKGLLEINPTKRLDVHKFLNHPWILSNEGIDTELVSPSVMQSMSHRQSMPIRDAFNIGYAIQRQRGEELQQQQQHESSQMYQIPLPNDPLSLAMNNATLLERRKNRTVAS